MRPVPRPATARPEAPRRGGAPLGDPRFRALLGAEGWAALPPAVRRRFGHRLAAGATATYVGVVTAMRVSRAGWLLAQGARLVGAPLPLGREVGRASVVSVTEDGAGGGQVWTRLYARASGFPQVIHSAKRFAGPTGLEEHLGRGLVMRLSASVEDGALVFRSAGYLLAWRGRRLALPRWASPGDLTVTHAEAGDGTFAFTLDLTHPRFGTLIHQRAVFRDAEAV